MKHLLIVVDLDEYTNGRIVTEHMVAYDEPPTPDDYEALKVELKTDPEFSHIFGDGKKFAIVPMTGVVQEMLSDCIEKLF
jgi:hypothetical protein